MRYITKEQAIHFVKAGVFPRSTSTDEIRDLTHAFGELPYKFTLSFLIAADEEVRKNARKLFALLFDESTNTALNKEAEKYFHLLNSLPELKRAAKESHAALTKALLQLKVIEYDPEVDKR